MAGLHRSQWLALVALFTSVAIALNFAFSVPAPYADYLFYEVWEIPILLALLLLGFWGGASVAGLNSLVLFAVKQGALPTGPLYNLLAELSMFLGVLPVVHLGKRKGWGGGLVAALATPAGILVRVTVMTVVNAVALPMPYPVGFSLPVASLPAFLGPIAVFNATITLYTIPLAFSVKSAVEGRVRIFGRASQP